MIPLPAETSGTPRNDVFDVVSRCIRRVASAGSALTHEEDVAQAVASYCESYCGGRVLSSGAISILAARALSRVGDHGGAAELLDHEFGAGLPASAFGALVHGSDCSPLLVLAISAGVVRPASWIGAGEGVTWEIDFSRLAAGPESHLDLLVEPAIRKLVEALAVVFDGNPAAGRLGLRGRLVAPGWDTSALKHAVVAALAKVATDRHWASVPMVLRLDSAG